jgi:hypothetical protein
MLVWAALYKLAEREVFFTNRVTNVWKSLPEKVTNAQSIDQFKPLFSASKQGFKKTI